MVNMVIDGIAVKQMSTESKRVYDCSLTLESLLTRGAIKRPEQNTPVGQGVTMAMSKERGTVEQVTDKDVTDAEDALAALYANDRRVDMNKTPEVAVEVPNIYSVKLGGEYVDVYDILDACNVTCPALQHLIKKALFTGRRGHKDAMTDLTDIVDSAHRARELGKKRQSNG